MTLKSGNSEKKYKYVIIKWGTVVGIILIGAIVIYFGIDGYNKSALLEQEKIYNFKCPKYYHGSHVSLGNSTIECVKDYYFVYSYRPSNETTKVAGSGAWGTIFSITSQPDGKKILYLDNQVTPWLVENTSLPLYVGQSIYIDQFLISPVSCLPYHIVLVNTFDESNNVDYYGKNATKIIQSGNYDGMKAPWLTNDPKSDCTGHMINQVRQEN